MHKLAKELCKIHTPLVGATESHSKNSTHFVQKVESMKIESDESMMSFDVVSLFTNVSIPLAIDIVRRKLESDDNLQSRTNWTIDKISEALKICVAAAYLYVRGKHFHQTLVCSWDYLFQWWSPILS